MGFEVTQVTVHTTVPSVAIVKHVILCKLCDMLVETCKFINTVKLQKKWPIPENTGERGP